MCMKQNDDDTTNYYTAVQCELSFPGPGFDSLNEWGSADVSVILDPHHPP